MHWTTTGRPVVSGEPRCYWHGVGLVESDDGWSCPMCSRPPDVDQLQAKLAAERAEIERLRVEVERLTQLHERIAASDDVAKAYQQVYFEDFPTVKQAAAETLLAKEQLAAERAEVKRLMEGMELAWGLIANGQYWDRTDGRNYGEWNEARLKWRDEHWHPALSRNKGGPS